jgi:radical SAM superfamily enzyme YgiQ (UPF0313 family)
MEAMLGLGKAFVQKYEPLGLLYIAAVAREAGHDVSVIDAHAADLDETDIRNAVSERQPDAVGISTLTCSGEAVYRLGRWMKAEFPGIFRILGNIHASVYARQYLENDCCDVVVHGDGEYAFRDVLRARLSGAGVEKIPHISYRTPDGAIRLASSPAIVPDLTRLPLPARDLVDQRLYRLDNISNQLYVGKARSTSKSMHTSRGCRYKCTFCVVNQTPRFNAAKLVVDEMELLERDFGADYTLIIDPLCMDDKTRMMEICRGVRERGLKIRWGCDARINCVTPELLEEMQSANCHDLSFGIESGVQRLLNRVKKGTTLERIESTVRMVKKNSSIQVGGLFILGLPGETEEDSLETIRFAKSLPLDMAQFSMLTPYPGSAVYEELAAQKQIDTGIREDGSLDVSAWRRYSAYASFTDVEPAWVTPGLTSEKLKRLQKAAQREFFLRPSMIVKHLKRVRPDNVLKMVKIAREAFL